METHIDRYYKVFILLVLSSVPDTIDSSLFLRSLIKRLHCVYKSISHSLKSRCHFFLWITSCQLSLSIAMTNRAVLLLLSLSAVIAVSVSVPVYRYPVNQDDRNPEQQVHLSPEAESGAVQNDVRQPVAMGGKVCYIK